MLYVFGGLPSAGKSVLSRFLAERLSAVHLRIDSIEQSLKTHAGMDPVGVAGYVSAYAIAKDNLQLGHTVIADSVNPIQITRNAWRQVAEEARSTICEIEVVCSDVAQHKGRYLARVPDIAGLVNGPWEDVVNREYEPWATRNILIDTASVSIADSQVELLEKVTQFGRDQD